MNKKVIYVLSFLLCISIVSSVILSKETFKIMNKKKSDEYTSSGKSPIEQLEYYTRVDPKNTEYLLKLGQLYGEDKQVDKSTETYKKVIEIDPHNYTAFFRLGNIQLDKGDFNYAFNYYDLSAKAKPNVMSYMIMSFISLLSNYDNALNYAQKASEIKIDNSDYTKKYVEYVSIIKSNKKDDNMYNAFINILTDYVNYDTLKLEIANKILNEFPNINEDKKKQINDIKEQCQVTK